MSKDDLSMWAVNAKQVNNLAEGFNSVGQELMFANTEFERFNKNLTKLEDYHNSKPLVLIEGFADVPRKMQVSINYESNISAEEKRLKELLSTFQDAAGKRTGMEESYNNQIAFLQEQNTRAGGSHEGQLDETIRVAEQQRTQALADYDNKLKEHANSVSALFGAMAQNSVGSMRETANELERIMNLLKAGDVEAAGNLIPDLSDEQLATLAASEEQMQRLQKEITAMREAADESETGFARMGAGLKKALESGGDTAKLQKGLGMLAGGFESVSKLGGMFADSLKNIGELTGSGVLSDTANGINSVLDVAGSALSGAQTGAAFGPVGAIIGAVAGIASATTNMLVENKKNRDMLKQQLADEAEQEYLQEFDLNRQYRERHEWAKKIGETNLEYLTRQGRVLDEMRQANQNEQDELMAKMQGTEYLTNKKFKETGLGGWGKGKIEEEWTSLAGKSFAEIERLADSGKLSEEGAKYFEALRKARQEGDKLANRQEDFVTQAQQMFTGTTSSALVDGIANAFKEGKKSAKDFAVTFEDLIRVSILTMVKDKLNEPIENWFGEFTEAAGKKFKDVDMSALRSKLMKIIDDGKVQIEQLETVTDIPLNSPKDTGNSALKTNKQFDEYIKNELFKLEKEKTALMADGMNKRLKLSELEFKEKQSLLAKEHEEQKKFIAQLNAGERAAARERLNILYDEQKQANAAAKTARDAKIREESLREIQEYEKQFTAFMFSEEQKRQQAIKDQYAGKQDELETKYWDGNITPADYEKLALMGDQSEQAELLKPLLDEFQTTDEKREKLATYYDEMIALLREMNEKEGGLHQGQLDGAIQNAENNKISALAGFDANAHGGDIYSMLFETDADTTLSAMRDIITEVEKFLMLIEKGKLEDARGIFPELSIEQVIDLAGNKKALNQLDKGLDNMRTSVVQSETGFRKMASGMKEVFGAGNDSKKLQEGLSHLSDGFSQVTAMGGMFADSLSNIGELTGSKALGSVADGIGTAMNVAGGAMQGAQAGMAFGPAGAAVGAAVGLASSVTKIFGENKKHREMLKQQIADNLEKEYFAEFDINRLYRERYEWTKKIGEATLTHLARQGAELNDQTAANAKEQDELWAKLMGEDYKSNEYFKKTGFMGWGKGKIVTEWTSLAGKSWEDIERLAASGKLSEDGMKYYEALKKAREEGEDLAKRQEEYLEQVRETFTGSSYESLVDSLIEGFKQGKRSAEDFADTFEDLMRGAVHSSLKLFLDESMRQWYEDWAAKAEDGLTEAEIEELRADYKRRIEEGNRKLEELENITGVSFSENEATQQASSKGFAAMSQDTGDELNGRFTALQMSGINLEQYALAQNQLLGDIRFDTATMSSNISLVNMSVDEIRDINRQSMNHLYKIEKNTALIQNTNDILKDIYSHVKDI